MDVALRTLVVRPADSALVEQRHRATHARVLDGVLVLANDPRPSVVSGRHVISYSLANILCWYWEES